MIVRARRPSMVPDVRAAFLRATRWGFEPHPNVVAMLKRTSEMLQGELVWVNEDMCDLLDVAMDTVPVDTELQVEWLPMQHACVFFARTMTRGSPWFADIACWRPVAIEGDDRPVLGMMTFDYAMSVDPPLIPNGITSWPFGTVLTDPATGVSEDEYDDALSDRKLVVALALLMSQPGITDVTDARIDRPAVKREVRRSGKTPAVRVVSLRCHSGGTGTGDRHLTKRFIVRGHWRQQAYGPAHSLRRPTWISPHVKGPDDAPLDVRQTVYAL